MGHQDWKLTQLVRHLLLRHLEVLTEGATIPSTTIMNLMGRRQILQGICSGWDQEPPTLYTEHLIITQRTYAHHETYTLHEMNMLSSLLCFNTFLPPLTAVSAGLSSSDFSLVLTLTWAQFYYLY